jgi:hypothetical protein
MYRDYQGVRVYVRADHNEGCSTYSSDQVTERTNGRHAPPGKPTIHMHDAKRSKRRGETAALNWIKR